MNDGAPPRPGQKVRTTLVDSGWSVAPPADAEGPRPEPARTLPSYGVVEEPGIREVTLVDREVTSRAKAMREKDTLPRPRRATAFPPASAPPGLRTRPSAPPAHPSAPPAHPSAPPTTQPVHAATQPVHAATRTAEVRPPFPVARSIPPAASVPPPAPSPPGPSADPAHSVSPARSAVTVVQPRPSPTPPSLPSFAAALAQRVRFAGGEVPLWSLVTPLVLLVALGTAFAAAAVTSAGDAGVAQKPGPLTSQSSVAALSAPPPSPPVVSANADEKSKPLTLLEQVASGDDAAIKSLSTKSAGDLRVEEAIALSLGQSARDVRAARALRERLNHDPGLIKDPEVLAELRRDSDDPVTARDALAAMASVPGPISADLIYEVWTATATRTTATDLARSLIYSQEVRSKASKALTAALDLRDADTCEKDRALLGRVASDGDRRAFHLLNKLTRKYGCGANKRLDCYACLRDGTDLDAALKAVKARRDPHPFGG